jgi:acetolactate synthase-1/2/3 large subunit
MLLTAQVALSAFGKGAAQESSPMGIDIVDLYKSVTKASLMLMSPEKMGDVCRHLLRTALTGRPGPVHMSLPADLVKMQVPFEVRSPSQYRPIAESFDRRSVRDAAKILLKAKHPAILAGYGVHISRAYKELKDLAERLHIPVATTQKGKGVFPENHILSLGVFGFAGSPRADAVLLSPETDVLIAVGTSLGEAPTHTWDPRLVEGKSFLQIDVDPRELGKNYSVSVGLVGDAAQVMTELNFQVGRDSKWWDADEVLGQRLARVRGMRAMYPLVLEPKTMEDASVPLKPQRVIAEMRRALPPESVLFVDIGNVMAWAIHYFPVEEPGTFFINMGFGSMGHAVSAAIGGKLAAPLRPVVALVGDGAFAMNGMEIHTAVENNIPVVWVVMNNGGHGMVHLGEKLQFKGKFNTSIFKKPMNISQIAVALGARAFRAEHPGDTELAIQAALASGHPSVVEVMIDPEATPPMGMRLKTLEKFFGVDKDEV